jgi:hypothetical protein
MACGPDRIFERADELVTEWLAEGEPFTEALTDRAIDQARAELED